MKYMKIAMGISAILIIGTAIMKILHLPGSDIADFIGNFVFIGAFILLSIQNSKLKKRVRELENDEVR